MSKLGYESLLALKIMRDNPGTEGSKICKKSDCSFAELFHLGAKGFADLGMGRVKENQCHPIITKKGLDEVSIAESDGII